jgi:hypothetical protein
MRRRLSGIGSALLSLLWVGIPAGAAEQVEPTRLRTPELRWYYNHAGAPPLVSAERVIEAGEEAARAWAPCGVAITYLAPATAQPGAKDGMSVVGWARGLYNAIPSMDPGGLTLQRVEKGRAVEVDIILAPQIVRTVAEIRFVLMHEFGHALGLTHTPDLGSLMSPRGTLVDADAHPHPSRAELQRCRDLYSSPSQHE